jgi:hypothetical protein
VARRIPISLRASSKNCEVAPSERRLQADVGRSKATGVEIPKWRWRLTAVATIAVALWPFLFQPVQAQAFPRFVANESVSATDFLRVEDTHSAALDEHARRIAGVDTYLKHIYAVYLGLRACSELSVERKDQSFQPSVALEEARRVLKSIDAATAEVGVRSEEIWASIAPQATVTAEALKADPSKHVEFCQRMGGLFRVDSSNLQSILTTLGAKTPLIQKDY